MYNLSLFFNNTHLFTNYLHTRINTICLNDKTTLLDSFMNYQYVII